MFVNRAQRGRSPVEPHHPFHQRLRHFSLAFAAAAVFSLGYLLGTQSSTFAQNTGFTQPPETEQAFQHFWQVYNLIDSQYIEDIDITTLVDGAVTGMVDALDDEYSGYMTPEDFEMQNSELEGEFEGIGVVITTNEDTNEIEIVGVLPESPAMRAGLLAGDVFVAVDGTPIADWSQFEFASRVRGPEGTNVLITVRRGTDQLDFDIVRARIIVPSVESRLIEDEDVAYVRLNVFGDDASEELQSAFDSLDVNNRRGLIFDLRDNTGGYLSSAIDVSSLFIEDGTIVTEDFGGDREPIVYEATGTYADIRVPIVVLTNELTASASEIVSGALQDLDLATIIGETTLGKGTVQTWAPLVNNGGVRLTIARWLTPANRWIHEQGVTPDIIIEWTPTQYNDPNDPQLAAALAYLRGETVEPYFEPTEETAAEPISP